MLAPLSEEGLRAQNENMDKLMGRLDKLSVAIGQLNPASSAKNSPSNENGDEHGTDRWQRQLKVEKHREKPKLIRQKDSVAGD